MKFVLVSILLLLVAAVSDAAYFRLLDYQPICFAEEVGYGSQVVMVETHRRRSSYADDVKVNVVVTSPVSKSKVHANKIRTGSGSFSFQPMMNEMGEYDICFSAPELDSTGGRHVDIAVTIDHHDRKQILPKPVPSITRQKVGENDEVFSFIDYDGQPKETLRTHEYLERIRSLLNGIRVDTENVKNEVKYFQQRTERMRQTSESTFDRIWGFSVLTMGVITACAYLQYSFLKSFLRAKKRV